MSLSMQNYIDMAHGAINKERDTQLAQVYATLALVQEMRRVEGHLAPLKK